jgi:hypothetical protein
MTSPGANCGAILAFAVQEQKGNHQQDQQADCTRVVMRNSQLRDVVKYGIRCL